MGIKPGRNLNNQTEHEKSWAWVHPMVKEFFTSALTSYRDTSRDQNFIGAEAMAYDKQMLPLYEWKGPGEVVLQQLIAMSPPVFQAQQVVPTGLAGIGSGQIWNGGLANNPLLQPDLSGEIV